ncbi:MAG: translocation/assembly module TamB domain-containing protein [Siphonobacter sp.]
MNFKRITKIVLASVGGLLLLIIIFLLILGMTTWGQNFVTKQVNNYLASKLTTPFKIGRISYQIPDWIQLEDVYFQTPAGDTLVSGGRLRVNMDMLDLIKSRITLNEIELDHVRVTIKRTLPDTTFNFNYLIDAFSSGKPADPADTSSAPLALSLNGIGMNDVRLHYVDDIAGADVRLVVDNLKAKFDEINPAESRYHIGEIIGNGLTTQTRIYKSVAVPSKVNKAATVPTDTMDLRIGNWQINRLTWDVKAEEAYFSTKGKVGQFNLAGDQLYLEGEQARISLFELINSDITAKLEKQPAPKSPPSAEPSSGNTGWKAALAKVRFVNDRIRFDDENAPRQAKGLDYGHLDIQNLNLVGNDLQYQPNLIAGKLREGRFKDKSGFTLTRLDGDVFYSSTQIGVTNMLIQTPGTTLKDRILVKFDSLGQLMRTSEANRVYVDVNLLNNKVSFADALQLMPSLATMPPIKGNENAVVNASIQAKGTLANLNLPRVEMSVLSKTRVRAKGKVSYPTDPNKMGLDLTIEEITTSSADVHKLAPKGSIPDSLSIPPQLQLTGIVKGKLNNIDVDASLTTAWGNAAFDGKLQNFVTGKGQAYTGTAKMDQFDLGKWLTNSRQYGTITATATVDGKGIDPKTMATTFDVNVPEATLMGYTYHQFAAKGNISQGLVTVNGGIKDPNANLSLNANADLNKEYPSVKGKMSVQTLDLYALKLYTDPFQVKGDVVMDFTSTDPNHLIGTLRTEGLNIQLKGQNYPVDSLYLKANEEANHKTLIAHTPFADLDLGGNFTYADLASATITEVSRYVTIPEVSSKPPSAPTDFTLRMRVRQHPLLLAFVPGLSRLEPVKIEATLDSKRADSTLNVSVTAGAIEYDTMLVAGANLQLGTNGQKMFLKGQVGEVKSSSMHLYQTDLSATAAQNRVQFQVMNKDSVNHDRHGLAGQLAINQNTYELRLNEKGLLTNYRAWTADTAGYVQYSKEGILADQFVLETNNQRISINSTEKKPNAPLQVELKNLILQDLAKLANQDSSLVAGTLNGDVIVKDYLGTNTKLSFTGDLKVDSLEVMQKALGNLNAKFANTTDDRISVQTSLIGATNDLHVDGFYKASSKTDALDLNVNLKRLDASTIEAFSFGQLRRAKGQLTGQMTVKGAVDKPALNGEIKFDSLAFNLTFVNATYRIDQETIVFNNQTIRFDKFDIKDSLNQALTTDGTVNIANLPNVGYNLQVTANKFNVLNSSRKNNDLVYGNASLTANLRIRGNGTTPAVTGKLKVDDGSNVTMVLPEESQDAAAQQLVTFIQPNDTTALMHYLIHPKKDSLNTKIQFEQLANSNISVDLEIDEHSQFSIVIDEISGDRLQAKGNANLNINMDAAGNIGIYGRYEVTQGEYAMTYEVLKRQFTIQKGSYIQFIGDPLKADLNITAIYQVEARPTELVSSTSTTKLGTEYSIKIPFNVALNMSGNLASPDINFDITLPESGYDATQTVKEAVNTKLAEYRQNESEMNKQVFALLVMGNFLPENSYDFFSGSGGGGNLAENVARNSVSKLISQQLNKLASSVIKGVDLNVNLNSSSDYSVSDGSAGARTDLNIGLSKSFMNGRLSVSVGKNFVLENTTGMQAPNQVFDNVSLNYNLTRDGRYMVRAYRKNSLEDILQGYIVETGIGFIITVDYNTFNEIFKKKEIE